MLKKKETVKKLPKPVQKTEDIKPFARTASGHVLFQDLFLPDVFHCATHSPYPPMKNTDTNVGKGTFCTVCGVSGIYLSEQTVDWRK